jgi:hypothetical protein
MSAADLKGTAADDWSLRNKTLVFWTISLQICAGDKVENVSFLFG